MSPPARRAPRSRSGTTPTPSPSSDSIDIAAVRTGGSMNGRMRHCFLAVAAGTAVAAVSLAGAAGPASAARRAGARAGLMPEATAVRPEIAYVANEQKPTVTALNVAGGDAGTAIPVAR